MMLRGFRALVVMLALVPATGVMAQTPTDKATALHAFADHLDGGTMGPGDQRVIYIDPGGAADVTMPPQTGPDTQRSPGGSFSVLGGITVERSAKEDFADGNLAAGTAVATSTSDLVDITVADHTISARGIKAVANASCDKPGTAEEAAAGSTIASLVIDGFEVPVGRPNQFSTRIDLPDAKGWIDIDALTVTPAGSGTGWTTEGLSITVHNVIDGPPPLKRMPFTHELTIGLASTSLTCAEQA